MPTLRACAQDIEIAHFERPFESGIAETINASAIVIGIDAPGSDLGSLESDTRLLFEEIAWTNAAPTGVAIADAASDPDFLTVVDRFTNGTDDRYWIGNSWLPGPGPAMGGGPESLLGFQSSGGAPAADLAGYLITRIELRVIEFALSSPGSDRAGTGVWTDLHAKAQFTFYGQAVPEPSALAHVALSLVALVRRSRSDPD
jgi:hypothetical protein